MPCALIFDYTPPTDDAAMPARALCYARRPQDLRDADGLILLCSACYAPRRHSAMSLLLPSPDATLWRHAAYFDMLLMP